MAATRMIATIGAGLAVLAGLGLALLPDPVQVDLVAAQVAPMEVTVDAEGMTRVRTPFSVTAPLTGIATRSPVQVGDRVERGQTVVAVIQPAEPAFLDARARRQAEAAVTEAEAAVKVAEANLIRTEAALAHATGQLDRNLALAARGLVAQRVLEDAEQAHAAARTAQDAARSELDLQRATLARMQAQLLGPQAPMADVEPGECCVEIRAPQSGTVLAVEDRSARLVQAGSPLLLIGDLADLEIEVDLLSTDAVRVVPGAEAHIDRWGGDGVIAARVRQIDPAAFTRVSALGIEEQRVRVSLDILTPPDARPGLGDQYRVFARIVIWSADAVLQIPQSALFRNESGWTVFRAVEGRAVMTPLEIGQRRADTVQVLSGLQAGDLVVAYPGNALVEGVRLVQRATQ